MSCLSYKGPNGQASILAQQLLDTYHNPAIVDRVMQFIYSDNFINEFGDWNKLPIDQQAGEPTFDWVKEHLQSYLTQEVTRLQLTEPTTKINKELRESQEDLKNRIRKELVEVAKANPTKLFSISYENTNSNYLNNSGYRTKDYADVISEILDEFPSNVRFEGAFQTRINNSPYRISKTLEKLIEDQDLRTEVNADGKILYRQIEKMSIPIIDDKGQTIGLFDEVDQNTAFQTVMGEVYKDFLKRPSDSVNKILENGLWKMQQYEMFFSKKGNEQLANKYRNIVNAFAFGNDRPSFTNMLFDAFKGLGYNIDDSVKWKILKNLDNQKHTYSAPLNDNQFNGESLDDFTKAIEDNKVENNNVDSSLDDASKGRGAEDWSDVSFEIDQRDTASTRIKMFLSTIEESEFGRYKPSADVSQGINLSHITDLNQVTLNTALQAHNKGIWHDDAKMLDSILTKLQTDFETIPFKNNLMMDELVAFDDLFENTLTTLAGQSQNTIEKYLSLLQQSNNPNLKALANKLSGYSYGKQTEVNQQLQNEFVKVFTKQYNPFLMVLSKMKTDKDGNLYNEARVIEAQRSSQIQTIVKDWQEQNKLSSMMKVREDGTRVLDTSRAKNYHLPLVEAYNIVLNKLNRISDTNSDEYKGLLAQLQNHLTQVGFTGSTNAFIQDANGERSWMQKQFNTIFELYGINLTNEMSESLFGRSKGKAIRNYDGSTSYEQVDTISKLTKGSKRSGDLAKQFKITEDGKSPEGMFSAFFMKAAGVTNDKDVDESNVEEGEEQATLNNPMYTESTTMYTLGMIASKFIPVVYSSTHKTVEGKKVWDYSQNTSLSKRIQLLKNDFDGLLSEYNDIDLVSKDKTLMDLSGSFYLRQWKTKPDYLNKFGLYYLEGLRFGNRDKGVTRQGMSDREQILTSILAYQNGGRDLGHFISLTHSDKTMTPMFYNVPKIKTGTDVLDLNIVEELRQVFYAEHRRIAKQWNTEFNDAKYDTGKKNFFFLPQFNRQAMLDKIGDTVNGIHITPKVINQLWNDDGTIVSNIDQFKPILEAYIQEHIKTLTNNAMEVWSKNGITPNMMSKSVYSRLNKQLVNKDSTSTQESRDAEILKITARDYTLNHFVWNVNMSALFYGDPAQVWKNSVDGTMKEYAKRLAKDIAPGQDLAFNEDETYNTVTLKDVEPKETYITSLGINNKSNGTDAQELTTTKEHLRVMYAAGLLSKVQYDRMVKVVDDANDGYYEFNTEDSKLVLQPMKPVYVGMRHPVNGAMLFDYVKSSSYPLLPQFTKGLEIDGLRVAMEKGNIQRANFISAKKIGAPKVVAQAFNDSGKFDTNTDLTKSVQTLSRSGFRIQQDVPYDEEKEAIKIVSQMNKLIMEGLSAVDTTFTLPNGTQFNSSALRQYKENLRKLMLDKNLGELRKKLGITQNDNGEWSKPNKKKIARLLIDEAKSRGYSKNEIDVLDYLTDEGEFDVPIFLHPSVEKFESLLMSIMRKTAETKMPGKSYVQASSVGYVKQQLKTDSETDKTNIVWVGDYDASKPLKHQQLVDGKVIPAQVIMPFNFFYEDKEGNNIKANIEDYVKVDDNGKRTIDTDKIPNELLQLIGARIPNQGHNSMVAMEIVGFTPENMGDIIIVPSAITGQMGSDFDVDKLYTYKRGYVKSGDGFKLDSPNTLEQFADELVHGDNAKDGIDYTNEDIQREYEKSFESSHLKNQYFDVHWAVLTNPDMYAKVLNPLDKDDLKEMNAKFNTNADTAQFYDITSQLSDFQSGKDAKALVGLTSLSVTFNSVIQDKRLKLGSYEYDKESKSWVEKPTSITIEYNGEVLELSSMSSNGTNVYVDKAGQEFVRTKHDNLTTIQSAAVDNAKDRTLDNLNITVSTYPAMAALHQLESADGKIVNVDFSTGLLVQESIQEFSREMRQGNDSMSEEFNKDLANSVLGKLNQKYIIDYYTLIGANIDTTNGSNITDEQAKELRDKIDSIIISPEILNKSWNKWQNGNTDSKEYLIEQLAVLRLFRKLLDYGTRLGELQKTLNQDTNGAGPNVMYAIQQVSNFINLDKTNQSKIFLNEDSIVSSSEQGYLFTQLMSTTLDIASELFPISAMKQGINVIMAETGKQLTDIPIDQQRDIIRDIRSFAFTGTDVFGINPELERTRLLNGVKDSPSLAVKVNEMKRLLPDNYFLQRLQTNINILGKGSDFISYENAKTVRLDDEKNVRAFMGLLNSTNKDIKFFAEDLIRYTYLLNPQNGPTSFIKHIPTSYLVATSFSSDMRELMNTLEDKVNSDVFKCQLFQHNPTLTKAIQSDVFGNYTMIGQDFPEMFMVNVDNPEFNRSDKDNPYVEYAHYRSKEGKVVLYRLRSMGNYLEYLRIDTLGKGDKTEYNAKADATVRSIFSDNRAQQEWTPESSMNQILDNKVDRMIGMSDDTENQYSNWGLPKVGKMLDMNRALVNLSNDKRIPEYLRTVANVMANSSQTHQGYEAIQAIGLNIPSFSIEVKPGLKALGSFTFSTGKLMLRPEKSRVKASETFLHEVCHQRTSALATAFGFLDTNELRKEGATENQIVEYESNARDFQLKHPELYSKFKRLDQIRFEALREFRKRMEADRIDVNQLYADLQEGNIKSYNHNVLYGLTNLNEFIAHAYTSKDVMQFLNTVESKGSKTFVDKVWDLLTDILVKLGDFIGVKVNDNSLLKEAFQLTLHLNNLTATEHLNIQINDGHIVPTTLILQNEAKANQFRGMVENVYKQEVEHTSDLTQHFLNITDKRIRPSSDIEMDKTIQKVLDKMEGQVNELDHIASKPATTEQEMERRISALAMKREIETDIQEMMQHQNLLRLGDLGSKQLDWVSNILNKSQPNIHEMIVASTLLNMWYDLNKTLYDGSLSEVNEKFSAMVDKTQGQATKLRVKMMQFGTNALRELGRERGVKLSMEDLGLNLKDIDPASNLFITLSRNGNAVSQLVTSVGQEAANNTDEEMVRLRNRLNKVEDLIKSYSKKPEDVWNKFIQQSEDGNTWGLVQALSADWYKTIYSRDGIFNSLRGKIYHTNTNFKKGTTQYDTGKREAFDKFWKELSKNGVVVDVRNLVDLNTGEELKSEAYQKEYDRLMNAVGNKEVVDKAIQDTIDTYKDYLEHKLQAFAEFDAMELSDTELSSINLTTEQLAKLNDAEQKAELDKLKTSALQDKIAKYKVSFINHNSPASFVDTSKQNTHTGKFNHELEFVPEFIPRKDNVKMFDENYKGIQEDTTLKQIYDELGAMSKEFRSYLPANVQQRLHDNFLPIVTNEDVSNYFEMLGKLSVSKMGQSVLNKLSVSQYDKDRVSKNEIPIDFVSRKGKDVEDLNKNLPKIFEMFGNMAIHYKNMRSVEEVVKTVQTILADVSLNRTEGRDAGEPLLRLQQALDFYRDMLIYKKPKKLELVSNTPIYDVNPVTNKKIEKRVNEIQEELVKLDEQILEGIGESDELFKDREVLLNELNKYQDNARYLTGSKAADVIIGINQLKALSFNPFSAVNNFTFGTISAFIHAYGKVDYTPTQLRKGFRMMKDSVARNWTFNKTSPGESNKISNVMDRMGVISEILETMYGKSNLSSGQKSEWLKAIDPYAWQKNGDYVHKGAMVLAMMQNKMVEVTENSEKKSINLYEALNDEGEWDSKRFGENKAWSSSSIKEQTEWNKFRDKARKVAIIVHGNQDKNAPILAKKYMLGRLVGQFRLSWLSEGVNMRIGKEYEDAQLGRTVKGRWRTYGELGVGTSINTILSQMASVFTKADPFTGKKTRKNTELTEVDKENMRKNLAGLMYTIAFLAAIEMIRLMGPSEEEKRRRRKRGKESINYNRLALNMLTRSYQDLALYSSPAVFDQVLGNPIPAFSVFTDAMKAMKAMGYLPFNDKKDAGKKAAKKVFRAIPFLNLIPKIDYMMSRDISSAAR